MDSLILFLFFSVLIALGVSYFQYFHNAKKIYKYTYILFALKALSFIFLFLLLYNPIIKSESYIEEKPLLNILVDDSKSISFLKQEDNITSSIDAIQNASQLHEKFSVNSFTFGKSLSLFDSLGFSNPQTNIFQAIETVESLNSKPNSVTILLSDGNQTFGNDYEFLKPKTVIYPLVFGDTASYEDISIANVNVNKYSYINNQFPVEVLLTYNGKSEQKAQFNIAKNGKNLYSKSILFSNTKKSTTISTYLNSTNKGLQYYDVTVTPFSGEKNTNNNKSFFTIDVIDETSKVALLSSVLHPDLGAIKKSIETNKERKVTLFVSDFDSFKASDYQIIILYQPNQNFNEVWREIKTLKANYLIITGTKTDWSFINQLDIGFQKNAINTQEYFYPTYNPLFTAFYQEDIGFTNFPPLIDQFGEITISNESDNLLEQTVNGIKIKQPLFTILNNDKNRVGVLFGEGIWKWRATVYRRSNSFEDFDKFMSNVMQLLKSKDKRDRLDIITEAEYSSNENILIKAYYTDENYRFDNRASLELLLRNKNTKEEIVLPFSLGMNVYELKLDGLSSGLYTYQVQVKNQNIIKKGSFKVNEFSIEEQFLNANHEKLEKLALNSGGKLYYPSQVNDLINELVISNRFYSTQRTEIQENQLIDKKWIMLIIVILISAEWFLRKYYGKI